MGKRVLVAFAIGILCLFLNLLLADLLVSLPVVGEVVPGLWSPPGADFDSYYDPVDLKIRELRRKGLDDAQIVIELGKFGMHWDIERNITSTGTPEIFYPTSSCTPKTFDPNP